MFLYQPPYTEIHCLYFDHHKLQWETSLVKVERCSNLQMQGYELSIQFITVFIYKNNSNTFFSVTASHRILANLMIPSYGTWLKSNFGTQRLNWGWEWQDRVEKGVLGLGITNKNDSITIHMETYYCRRFLRWIHILFKKIHVHI